MRTIPWLAAFLLSCSTSIAQAPGGSNFRPNTGLGLFDAELDNDRLEVTLSVFYSFLEGDRDLVPGFKADEYRWTDTEKDDFRRAFANQTKKVWSWIYDFEHSEAPQRRIEVVVEVEEADSAEKADWFVRVSKYPDHSPIPAASVCDPGSAHQGDRCSYFGPELTQGTVKLSWPDRNPTGTFSDGIEPVTYHFHPRESRLLREDLDDQYPVRLLVERGWASRVDAWATWTEVSGRTSTDEDPSIGLARERAEALRIALLKAGASEPRQVVVHGAFPEDASRAVTLTVFPEGEVSTLAHEAGHMLGLEDEAETGDSCTGSEGIGADYASAVHFYGFGRLERADTNSLMSRGTVVYCRHYLPFLEALEILSKRKSGWSFAPGREHPGHNKETCPDFRTGHDPTTPD